jgi:hypothetical protein
MGTTHSSHLANDLDAEVYYELICEDRATNGYLQPKGTFGTSTPKANVTCKVFIKGDNGEFKDHPEAVCTLPSDSSFIVTKKNGRVSLVRQAYGQNLFWEHNGPAWK